MGISWISFRLSASFKPLPNSSSSTLVVQTEMTCRKGKCQEAEVKSGNEFASHAMVNITELDDVQKCQGIALY